MSTVSSDRNDIAEKVPFENTLLGFNGREHNIDFCLDLNGRSNLINFLCSRCKELTLDRSKCTLQFTFPSSEYFNIHVKPAIVARFNRPYLIFINYFDEVTFQLSLRELFSYIFDSAPETPSSKLRIWTNKTSVNTFNL